MSNLIYNPDHYNKSGRMDCWSEMRVIFGDEAVAIFDVLNAYKYHYRAGEKENNPAEQDIRKMYNYLEHGSDIKTGELAERCYMAMMEVLDNEQNG